MGSLCRSQEMLKLRLFIEKSVAHETMVELANMVSVTSVALLVVIPFFQAIFQLNDMNQDKSSFQRTFAADVRLCDEMQRRLRFLEDQVDSYLVER